jgi:hypothetical protein
VAAIVIEPPPLVIVIPVPEEIVARVNPDPLPIARAPLAAELQLTPIPPLSAGSNPVSTLVPPAKFIAPNTGTAVPDVPESKGIPAADVVAIVLELGNSFSGDTPPKRRYVQWSVADIE